MMLRKWVKNRRKLEKSVHEKFNEKSFLYRSINEQYSRAFDVQQHIIRYRDQEGSQQKREKTEGLF